MPAATLYRFRDAAGALLYVGVTNNLAHRLYEHRQLSRFAYVASVETTPYGNRGDALGAEAAAIILERPAWNVVVPVRGDWILHTPELRRLHKISRKGEDLREQRDAMVRELVFGGVAVRDICAATGLSPARIYQIRDNTR